MTTEKRKPQSTKRWLVTENGPNPIDIAVGQRLRTRREISGLTQNELALATGVTFQQVQKYETARNRLSVSRLYQFARILGVPPSYFFEDLNPSDKSIGLLYQVSDNEQEEFIADDVSNKRETAELLRTYYAIQDEKVRKDVLKIMKQMAKTLNS